ncbi:hypothetical protein EKK58_06285 [Candidatus Dependentiae bacterium]|nr:MAG: hypothetical protein EKK58_06285 [Candidatus Dependentiae bacterium]
MNMFCIFFIYFLATNIIGSEHTTYQMSLLELYPGQGLQSVELPFQYYHMKPTENQSTIPLLLEGNYTILSSNSESVLVGPLLPCQLFYAYLPTKNTTIAAHIAAAAQFERLLQNISKLYGPDDWILAKIILFTNKDDGYDKNNVQVNNNKYIAFKTVYQNRTQEEELKHNKLLIYSILQIKQENIITLLFDFNNQLGHYLLARLFVLVKNGTLYSTCPVKENYFQTDYDNQEPTLGQKKEDFRQCIAYAKEKNPFFYQYNSDSENDNEYPLYNSLPFVKI